MDKLLKIELTRNERDMILGLPKIDPEIERKLNVTAVIGNAFIVRLAPDKVSGLIALLTAEAGRSDDEDLQRSCRALQSKLERAEKA
jgi:hypothetical protein